MGIVARGDQDSEHLAFQQQRRRYERAQPGRRQAPRKGDVHAAQVRLVNQVAVYASGQVLLIDADVGVIRHRQFRGQGLATHTHASDDRLFGVRIVQTDAPEIDRQAVFQGSNHDLEDTPKVLALANRTSNLAEQIQLLQLSPKLLLGSFAIGDIPGAAEKADGAPLVILENFPAPPHPADFSVRLLDAAFKLTNAAG